MLCSYVKMSEHKLLNAYKSYLLVYAVFISIHL